MKKLKIVQWNSATCWGGGEIRMLEICDCLRERGHSVFIVCRKKSPVHLEATSKKYPVNFKAPRNSGNILRAFLIGLRLKKWGADVIHAHAGKDYVPAIISGIVAGCPVVIHRHLFAPLNPLTRWLCKNYNTMYIGDSQKVADGLIKNDGFPEKRVFGIHLCVDARRVICSSEEIERLKEEFNVVNRNVIVSVGHLYPSKGHKDLIEAVAILRDKGVSPIVLIAGEGAERKNLENLIERLKLRENVRLLGERKDVPALLHLSDFFALLSYEDPFPGAIIEAFACKKPVVGCNAGGVPEMIKDGVTGFLVPPRNPSAAAEVFHKLIADRALCKKLGENARKDFEERFSIDKMIDKIEKVYEGLLDETNKDR